MTVGERIKQRRQELHLTQQQLADKMGKTKSAICRVEKDVEQNLTLDRVTAFAKALGCSESFLMGWEISIESNDLIMEGYNEGKLLKKYSQLTEENKSTVRQMIDFLLANQNKEP